MAQPALKVVDAPMVDKDKAKAIDAALSQMGAQGADGGNVRWDADRFLGNAERFPQAGKKP